MPTGTSNHQQLAADNTDNHRHHVLTLEQMRVVRPLGRGAKGVVFLVREEEEQILPGGEKSSGRGGGELWALKVIWRELVEKKSTSKETLVKNGREYRRIYFEQQVLSQFNHPLLPRLRGVLSTEKIVAYAIDYCSGHDLNFLRKQQSEKMFSLDFIRFYGAELVLALEYLHNLGIAYRDLKPENVMVQDSGHLMLVDFDLSTKLSPITPHSSPINYISVHKQTTTTNRKSWLPLLRYLCNTGVSPEDSLPNTASQHLPPPLPESDCSSSDKSNSFVGTEEYVAPEIIQGNGHDFAVDWWSFGVVLYEMLYGVTPFKGSNRKETFYRILTRTPELVGETTPLRDLIGKLLVKDPKERIGLEGIKRHDFFKGVDWDLILQISRPPYIPVAGNEDAEVKEDAKKGIEVEEFVEGIFFGRGEIEKKNSANDNNIHEEKSNNSGTEEGVWVKELNSQHPRENDNFHVF